jgi:hypothetical protein
MRSNSKERAIHDTYGTIRRMKGPHHRGKKKRRQQGKSAGGVESEPEIALYK